MNRTETAGIGIALVGHAALLALLVLGLSKPPQPPPPPAALEVSISDEVGLTSQAPVPSKEAPAEKKADELGPVTPDIAPPVPTPPAPEQVKRPEPPKAAEAPTPLPVKRPVEPKPAAAPAAPAKPAEAKPVRPTGRLTGLLDGLSDSPTKSQSTTPPASSIGPQVRSALAAEIIRQIKPHWAPPTGADVDKLRTTVIVALNADGSLAGQPRVTQTGVTDTNRAQAQLHKERAIRAVQLAAPFHLPPEFYQAWKTIGPTLYEGL